MSRLVTSIAILAVMSVGCAASVAWVDTFTDRLSSYVEEVEQAFTEDDTERSVEAAETLRNEWDKFIKYSIFVNDLGHAVEITSSIAEVYSFAQEANEELYASCDRVQAQIKLFKDMQIPTLWKIL